MHEGQRRDRQTETENIMRDREGTDTEMGPEQLGV